jgi:hypothetical protein
MGGTPAVKLVREGLVGEDIQSIAGILNGTCNFILSDMEKSGRSFADVLAEAQRLGYAEADPTMDVGGFDAAHKISILAALAFGCAPTYAAAEIEGIEGVEDDVGSDAASALQSLEVAVDFITRTGVDCFAPAIGNAHGQYKRAPKLNHQRVTDLVEATGVPMALHGGTGLSPEQFKDLIPRGCAKVNISTALKESYMKSGLEFLRGAEEKGKWDPPSLFAHQRAAVVAMAREHIALFGGSGRAW